MRMAERIASLSYLHVFNSYYDKPRWFDPSVIRFSLYELMFSSMYIHIVILCLILWGHILEMHLVAFSGYGVLRFVVNVKS